MKKILLLLLVLAGLSPHVFSQNQKFHLSKPTLIKCNLIRITPPLTQLKNEDAPRATRFRDLEEDDDAEGQIRLHKAINPNALPKGLDPAMQKTYNQPGSIPSSSLLVQQFAGLGFTGVNPSDNNMAAGPNHVVQMINNSTSSFVRIWNKTGTILVNQLLLSTVTGHGGFGDPVVLYDNLADRYLISEFGSSGNHIYIAVSQTADPTGSYFVYDFTTPQFPDYFKLAAFGNSYIVTSNENLPATYALDRTKMLAGTPTTTAQRFTIPAYPTIGFQAATPVDVSGSTAPSAGSPALFMRMADDAWTSGIVDRLEIFSLNVDWVTPANTTLTGPDLLPTLPFSTNFCGYTTFSCIPQQGSSVKLDPLREVLMNKVSYRKFPTYEAIVCCHVNDLDGTSHAGVRWYELRKTPPSTNWVIYQQGTYGQASDPLNRWMSCIAINGDGSIGLGYNVAGTTSFPSIRYTGRRACDPLGQMTEPETTVIAGTAANASIRYGDYNGMTVDPVDGSFWFTANYNPAAQWATRVANFTLSPSCGGCSPTIVTNPSNTTVCAGSTATFTVTANGSPLTYQWQESTNGGGSFTDIPTATAATYSFIPGIAQNNNQYRCVVTGTCAPTTATSTAGILTVNAALSILTQPANATLCAGANTSFTVGVTGSVISYQWQLSTDGGASYNNVSNGGIYGGATTTTLGLTGVTAGLNNNRYRCVVTGNCPSINSAAGILTVNTAPVITLQPAAGSTICAGQNTSFTVSATGSGAGYQWQESTNAGANWTNITNGGVYGGAGTGTLTLTAATAGMNSNQYRCVISGSCTPSATSNVAALTVFAPVSFSTQPANITVCATGNTGFTVTASGSAPAYQWQVSTNNGVTFNNISNIAPYSGTTTNTLVITGAAFSMNGYQYRCVVSGSAPCPSINSGAATLTVGAQPTIIISASPYTKLFPGLTTILTATTSLLPPVNYVWYRNNVVVTGNNSNTLSVSVNNLGDYKVTVTNPLSGCTNTSSVSTISDSASNKLFIFPSPNNGIFHIAYYNPGGGVTTQNVTIYDSYGRRVFNTKYPVSQAYQVFDIDMRRNAAGVYFIVLREANGNKVKTGRVEIR